MYIDWFHGCKLVSKHIKLYTLNICSFLCQSRDFVKKKELIVEIKGKENWKQGGKERREERRGEVGRENCHGHVPIHQIGSSVLLLSLLPINFTHVFPLLFSLGSSPIPLVSLTPSAWVPELIFLSSA